MKNSDFQKKSENFRKHLKIPDFQKNLKNSEKSENFRFPEIKLKKQEKI